MAPASHKWNTRFFRQCSLTQLNGQLLEEAAPNMTGGATAAEDDLKHHHTAELFRPTTQQTTRKGKQDDALRTAATQREVRGAAEAGEEGKQPVDSFLAVGGGPGKDAADTAAGHGSS
ncbi:hypothetical protein Q4I30_005577 [Leishmania utingensis]|uniref:Uncharacterized protein n=1 Tax=Leishmania utingensis TaxID=653362 RepID=A0AAW3A8M2_9TRYP